ncbi:MAG: dihydroorotate dehydrogenase electron transfer subunit [Clostridia bacterium]|nr:dihydroorotate dehydrogenase electron transfer subunit [Clostridia bacterium]
MGQAPKCFLGVNGMKANVKVMANFRVKENYYLMELQRPEVAKNARAGQFIHARCKDSKDPLLRRPFSIYSLDSDKGRIKILYEIKGMGTELLSKYKEGDFLDIMAPLGNGFNLEGNISSAILVGGGIGGAPLMALAESLKGRGINRIYFLVGAQSKDKLIPTVDFESLGVNVITATDDGSEGHRGYITDLLPMKLKESSEGCTVFACGPRPMLKAVAQICARKNIPCQLSLEEIISCGVGACQGCVCKVKDNDTETYHRVCLEGPVFDSGEVVWDV